MALWPVRLCCQLASWRLGVLRADAETPAWWWTSAWPLQPGSRSARPPGKRPPTPPA